VKCNSDTLHQHASCKHTSNHKAYKQNHHVLFASEISLKISLLISFCISSRKAFANSILSFSRYLDLRFFHDGRRLAL
jgi:hypothetical protein